VSKPAVQALRGKPAVQALRGAQLNEVPRRW